MDRRRIEQIRQKYDSIIHINEGADIEFWYARDLMNLFGYDRWENFDKAVCRAVESCETSGISVSDHFREVTKMIPIGKGGKRTILQLEICSGSEELNLRICLRRKI